jgi:hypothetical protein
VPLPWGFIWYIETGDEVTVEPDNNNNGNCFLSKTLVTMADGTTKRIEDIDVGDVVLSYNLLIDDLTSAIVTKVFHHPPEEMGSYYLIINNQIRVTPNHLMLVNGKIMPIVKACRGDTLGIPDEKTEITSIEEVYEQDWSYNFEILPWDETIGQCGDGGNTCSYYYGMNMYVLYGWIAACFYKYMQYYQTYYTNQYYWYY